MSSVGAAGAGRALVQGGPAAERVAEGRDEEAVGRAREADTVRREGTRLGPVHVHRAESPRRKLHVRKPHRQRYAYAAITITIILIRTARMQHQHDKTHNNYRAYKNTHTPV